MTNSPVDEDLRTSVERLDDSDVNQVLGANPLLSIRAGCAGVVDVGCQIKHMGVALARIPEGVVLDKAFESPSILGSECIRYIGQQPKLTPKLFSPLRSKSFPLLPNCPPTFSLSPEDARNRWPLQDDPVPRWQRPTGENTKPASRLGGPDSYGFFVPR
ncbi:hypothetical protein S7711_11195 [Stachybotrys chartarum IBT 7711]|uniref:Uncharacterized protein n=1 Tax=Stachybotrys chartarum (strain CBS 109288 / IBT 7711) TaxID=1280523 RepID=A0A084AXN6_STACB|nr:hypothetical protein S7711_11195 [Stachybotrys chartarum IBT 7711]KFA71512.1 hypothetical protein S40288_11369 [Stachybotrys chartarum IBT 40288]